MDNEQNENGTIHNESQNENTDLNSSRTEDASSGEYHYTYTNGENPGNYYSSQNNTQNSSQNAYYGNDPYGNSNTYYGSQDPYGSQNAYGTQDAYGNQNGQNYYSGQNPYGGQVPPSGRKMKPKKPKKKAPKWMKLVGSAVAFGLIAGLVFQGVNLAGNKITGRSTGSSGSAATIATTSAVSSDTASDTTSQTDIEAVASSCMPSIVSITNMSVSEVQNFFGSSQQQESESVGSGIIVGENDTELLIVTNNHVIEDAQTLTVSFVDNNSVSAQVKGADSDKDIAVVAVKLSDISADTMSQIKIATLGDSSSLKVGQTAIAIGNALGYGQSVTSGIISAVNRTISDSSITCALIQTDAAINPGNSGGALLNSNGEVIGINAAKVASTDVESMGYAIPISDVTDIINELMNKTTREKVASSQQGALGIKCTDVSSSVAQMYNMPTGVYVSEVVSGGAAEAAGIEKGDVITKFDGSTISTTDGLKNMLQYYKAGETVTITVERVSKAGEYEAVNVEVTLQANTSN